MPPEPCAQRVGRGALVALVVCAVVAALVRPASGAAGRPACAEAVLDDWTRGVLDSSYAPECYQAAVDALPEDLRAYTTAADDIRRTAIAATRAVNASSQGGESASRPFENTSNAGDPLRAFPKEVAVLVALIAVLLSVGAAAAVLRWRRGR